MTTTALIRRKPTEVGFIDKMPNAVVRLVPPVKVGSTVMWLFLIGFGMVGGLAAWASVAKLQSAVVATGQFRIVGDKLVVQHLEGGLVQDITVKEGDIVQAGDPLITLDGTLAHASVDILKNQLVSALSTQARLQAEFDEAPTMAISAELADLLASNPSFAAMVQTQTEVLESNTRISRGQIEILQERISQLREQKIGLDVRLQSQQTQLSLTQEETASRTRLLEKGLTTKSAVLAMRRDEAGLEGNAGVTQSQLQGVLQQIAEVEARKLQVRRDYLKDITEGRQQVNERIFDIRQRLAAAQDVVERQIIRAPRAGQIMSLQVNTVGSVIAAGQKLMDVVPADAGFVIEAMIAPNDVNQVVAGGHARVRLTGYNYRTTPMIDAEVTAVSADRLISPTTGASYFEAKLTILPGQLEALKDVKIIPGMPAQVMIATGEQTLANYMLSPVLGGYERALLDNE